HDDLRGMDNDEERRGQPSTWKKFGEGTAVLAGDALLAEAFRLAARYGSSAVARELAEATLGMIGGQYLDTMVEGYDLAAVHRLKTGRLFYASVTMALWAAELPEHGQAPWRGLAESRAQAQALLLAGLVPGYDKPGQQVDENAELAVDRPPPYVSRGGEKLAHGLDGLGVDPAGLDCVDVGASTGGFTDVLLQRGAARVIALDVGYGQLHPRLRADPRVTVLERTNARTLTELPFEPQLAVCDVSFISVRLALPPVLRLCAPEWQAVVLVKPQFEAGRADVGKG